MNLLLCKDLCEVKLEEYMDILKNVSIYTLLGTTNFDSKFSK